MLAELGYGFAYRVLDAQYFGVAQRRRRVFVVANARSWQRAAAVLFESHSLQGHPAPSREAREGTAQCLTAGVGKRYDPTTETLPVVAETLIATDHKGPGHNRDHNFIAQPVASDQTAGTLRANPGSGWRSNGTPVEGVVIQAMQVRHGVAVAQPIPIDTMNHLGRGDTHSFGDFRVGAPSYTLTKGHSHAVATAMQVRRLTPVECERLQGFPDGYTNIPWRKATESPDGPRYKALGNSMAVPVMAWIGKRIQQVSEL